MNTWNWKPASEKPDNSCWCVVMIADSVSPRRLAWYDFIKQRWMAEPGACSFYYGVTHWCELPPPPPKPDPFEEWWMSLQGGSDYKCIAGFYICRQVAKSIWQAALKSKEP